MGVNPIFGQDGQGGRRRKGKREGMKAISGLNSSPPLLFFWRGVGGSRIPDLVFRGGGGGCRSIPPGKKPSYLDPLSFLGTKKNLRTLLDSSSRPIWEVNAALRPSRFDLGCWKSEY